MMNDQQIRLECLKLAISTPGDPNVLATARRYVEFVTEAPAPAAPVEAPKAPKGPRKA